jgi:hypothetical protein
VAAGIAVVLAAMAVAAVVRLRTADTPLERDEGEYVYSGQLILDGVPPYRLAYKMIAEVEAARPEYAVEVATPCSWLVGPDSERKLLAWARAFLRRHYVLIGVADILSPTETRFVWDAEVRRYRPRSYWFVNVFRRR